MFKSMTVNLMVRDIHRSIAFYDGILGVELAFAMPAGSQSMDDGILDGNVAGRDLAYAQFRADNLEIMVQTAESLAEDTDLFAGKEPGATASLYIIVEEFEALLERIAGHDILAMDPRVTWYGMAEVCVRDPDGYILCFAQPAG